MSADFKQGTELTTSGKTIMSYDLEMFQELTGWSNQGKNEVSEILVQMTSVGLLNRILPLEEKLIAVVGHSWEFLSSVAIADTLTVSCKIVDLVATKKKGKVIAHLDLETNNQDLKTVARGEWRVLIHQP
jgi:hypothetical protein